MYMYLCFFIAKMIVLFNVVTDSSNSEDAQTYMKNATRSYLLKAKRRKLTSVAKLTDN